MFVTATSARFNSCRFSGSNHSHRTGWRLFDVFLPGKRLVVRLDAAREIDGKRKRILTPSNVVLYLNFSDPAGLFVTNKIQAPIYPIH